MTTHEEFIDDALYLPEGTRVKPLIWNVDFSASIGKPLKVTPANDDNGNQKRTTDKRYQWKPEERPYLVASDGTPLGPLRLDRTWEGRDLILTTEKGDVAKNGKTLKRRRLSH